MPSITLIKVIASLKGENVHKSVYRFKAISTKLTEITSEIARRFNCIYRVFKGIRQKVSTQNVSAQKFPPIKFPKNDYMAQKVATQNVSAQNLSQHKVSKIETGPKKCPPKKYPKLHNFCCYYQSREFKNVHTWIYKYYLLLNKYYFGSYSRFLLYSYTWTNIFIMWTFVYENRCMNKKVFKKLCTKLWSDIIYLFIIFQEFQHLDTFLGEMFGPCVNFGNFMDGHF